MHSLKNIPPIRRVRAIARLREYRQARAQEAVRAAKWELQRLSDEINKLTEEIAAVRAQRQSLYDGLPESMPRSRLLELKRREHFYESRRIDLALKLTQHRTEQEEAKDRLHQAQRNLAEAQHSLGKIEHFQKLVWLRSARIELTQSEIESGEHRQYR